MNRSKPSTVVGGGEMKRATSADVNSWHKAAASDSRSSRSRTVAADSTGSVCFQSVTAVLPVNWLVFARSGRTFITSHGRAMDAPRLQGLPFYGRNCL